LKESKKEREREGGGTKRNGQTDVGMDRKKRAHNKQTHTHAGV